MPTFDSFIIVQKGKKLRWSFFPLQILAALIIYTGLIPILLSHFWCWLYTSIYFPIFGIPAVRLEDYLMFDRAKLKKLNWVQRMNCMYCSYANGVTAWFKATANMTEVYSCAIKHSVPVKGHEHQKDFFPYEDFLK